MKLSQAKLVRFCRQRHLTLSGLLSEAGVSRNAFYSLLRKRELLPRSISAVAAALNVSPAALLEDTPTPSADLRQIVNDLDAIMRCHPEADRDDVRHTLILLRDKPIERLRRALLRARKPDLQR
jgi:hypothetical protein